MCTLISGYQSGRDELLSTASDDQLRKRIELLQDFTMPTAATRMVASRDGQYLLTAGVQASCALLRFHTTLNEV